jgi:membrane protein YqaA with SNARE-associated domain
MDSIAGSLGVYAATLIAGAISAVVPVVNAELYLVAVVLAAGDLPTAIALALLISVGQMVGKGGVFQAALHATNAGRRGKLADKIDRARELAKRWRGKPYVVTFVSAAVSLPPFYLTSIAAGVMRIRFRMFLLLGFAGRAIRFGTIAVLTSLA